MAISIPKYAPRTPMYASPEDMQAGIMTSEWSEVWRRVLAALDVYNYDSIVEVYRGTFASNDPSAGYVSWTGIHFKYNGVKYVIANDNTNDTYIYWSASQPNVFLTTNTLPTPTTSLLLMGWNDGGTFNSLWRPEDIQTRVLLGLDEAGQVNPDKVIADSMRSDAVTLSDYKQGQTHETFEDGSDCENYWNSLSGFNVAYPARGKTGGKVCSATNYTTGTYYKNIPFNPDSLYRAVIVFRRYTTDDAAEDNLYLRLHTFDQDGAATSTAYKDLISAFDLGTLTIQVWEEKTIWFKGTGTGGTGTATDPYKLPATTAYFNPRFFLNGGGDDDNANVSEIDSILIEPANANHDGTFPDGIISVGETNPSAYQFTGQVCTNISTWYNIDLSSYITAGHSWAIVRARLVNNGAGADTFQARFRRNGDTNLVDIEEINTNSIDAGGYERHTIMVPLDTDGIFEYAGDDTDLDIDFQVFKSVQ